MDNNRFRQRFIPTVFWYAAISQNPWNISNEDGELALSLIWAAVYKNTIGSTNEAVLYIVRFSMFFPMTSLTWG